MNQLNQAFLSKIAKTQAKKNASNWKLKKKLDPKLKLPELFLQKIPQKPRVGPFNPFFIPKVFVKTQILLKNINILI